MDFYQSWWFIYHHPMNKGEKGFNYGTYDMDIYVTRVNPETMSIEDNDALNTKTQVWLEYGPYHRLPDDEYPDLPEYTRWRRSHDPILDCGSDTFEGAIIELAHLIRKHYGGYDAVS